MPNNQKQEFLGGLIGSIVAKKGIETVVDLALKKVAKSPKTDMTTADVPVVKEAVTEAVVKEVQSRVDHVTDQEPFYKSRNTWASFVGIVTAIDLIFRMWTDGLPNTPSEYLTPIGIIVAALTPLYSRYIAKKPLGE